jgi:hypothetical protein
MILLSMSDDDGSREERYLGVVTARTTSTTLALTVTTTIVIMFMIHCLIQRKRFIDRVNQLPSPPIITSSMDQEHQDHQDHSSPWLASLGVIQATTGTIPNHPGIPQVIPCFEKWSRESMPRRVSFVSGPLIPTAYPSLEQPSRWYAPT